MSAYVMLTAFMFQRGSAESKGSDETVPQDADPVRDAGDSGAPLPVRLGGFARSLYSYSLGLALFLLFVAAFAMHVRDSAAAQAAEALLHGDPAPTVLSFYHPEMKEAVPVSATKA